MKLSAGFVNGYNAFVKGESTSHYANVLNAAAMDSVERGWREANYAGATEKIVHEYNDATVATLRTQLAASQAECEELRKLLRQDVLIQMGARRQEELTCPTS